MINIRSVIFGLILLIELIRAVFIRNLSLKSVMKLLITHHNLWNEFLLSKRDWIHPRRREITTIANVPWLILGKCGSSRGIALVLESFLRLLLWRGRLLHTLVNLWEFRGSRLKSHTSHIRKHLWPKAFHAHGLSGWYSLSCRSHLRRLWHTVIWLWHRHYVFLKVFVLKIN